MNCFKTWLGWQNAEMSAFRSQTSCSRAVQTVLWVLISTMLLIQLASCCKQGPNGKGQSGREPGAQVTFGINLGENPLVEHVEQAEISIDGKLISAVKDRGEESVFLPKGNYRIRITADGFEPIEKEILVQDSPTQTFRFTLKTKR